MAPPNVSNDKSETQTMLKPLKPAEQKAPGIRRSIMTFASLGFVGALSITAWGALSPVAIKLPVSKAAPALNLKNWGLANTQAKSHINVVDAWKISEGSKDVVVAVIDTGVDSTHPDLAANMWQDPNAPVVPVAKARVRGAAAQIGAGSAPFKARVYGWNFVNDQANPIDDHGHGTHVAGIIGAVTNPKTGVSGVAKKVSIMGVKYYSDANPGAVNLRNTVKAINYAVDHGARIINYSGGGPEFSEDEYLAIKRAEAKGVLFISAAGNEHQDTDLVENYYYPSAYRLSNIIAVAATDINNQLLKSSNWGKTRVDVAAPGENIFSTLPNGRYGYMTGTSQATAFVTGLAALLLSKDPSLTPQQIKQIIVGSVDKLSNLEGKLATGGRVNAAAALASLMARKKAPAILADSAKVVQPSLIALPGSAPAVAN